MIPLDLETKVDPQTAHTKDHHFLLGTVLMCSRQPSTFATAVFVSSQGVCSCRLVDDNSAPDTALWLRGFMFCVNVFFFFFSLGLCPQTPVAKWSIGESKKKRMRLDHTTFV